MKYITIVIVLVLLLVGCSPSIVYVDRNNTIYINQTVYKNRTILIGCNETCQEPEPCQDNNAVSNIELIRRIKSCEKRSDDYITYNESVCMYDLNQSNIEKDKALDELCEWNSSWC